MDYKNNKVEDLERVYADLNAEPVQISYELVKSITKDFAQVIGYGAFGVVYLGALRNGLVAVKKINPSKDLSDTEFLDEVKCLQKVKHKNIVRFLGYCADAQGVVQDVEGALAIVDMPKRFLCLEYVPNGSLDNYIQEKRHGYGWDTHYQIIKGICEGLHYLHGKRMYHLDLKPANVLLGTNLEPKISDFGLSRCIDGSQYTISTVNVKGTLGYMAPELINNKTISAKSDIYSLGVIMNRLLTGSNSEYGQELLNVDCQQMTRCIHIAQICIKYEPSERPTISDIICQLDKAETTIQNVPGLLVLEPRHDPMNELYQVVKRFVSLPAQTPGDYHRVADQLPPVERPMWKLALDSPPKLPIITGKEIQDTNGNPLKVILMDADTSEPSVVPEVLQIELVPLVGNFPRDSWDMEDFQKGVVENLDGKKCSLLGGPSRLTMWDGCAKVHGIMFTDDSRIYGCMLRIGVRVVPGTYNGPRILEAMSEAFMVRDRHSDQLHHKWQLAFQSQPRLPIYVGSNIRDVTGKPLEVILIDGETGSPSVLPMVELDIQVVPLLRDVLPYNIKEDWSGEEFRRAIVKQREGEPPLLTGDVSLTMKDGWSVTVNELQFTDNSSVLRLVSLGVYVSGGYNGHGRILEGMTKTFKVEGSLNMINKDFRLDLRKDVWRLNGIKWGGDLHWRLTQNNIGNVQDFLRMLAVKPKELRAIIGEGMDDLKWQATIDNARRCVECPHDKVYAYSLGDTTIYLNSIFDLVKVEFGGVECQLQQLKRSDKGCREQKLVQQTIREAYNHRDSLQELQLMLKLEFKSKPRLPIYVGSRIKDAMGNPLEIILVDAKTGLPYVHPRKLVIQLVPLLGDFPPYDDEEDWSAEEFKRAIVKRRQGKEPLFKGEVSLVMKDGRVTVNKLRFTDNSSWVRCKKFCIGAYVPPQPDYNNSAGRILEAITEAFGVEEPNKHYPPVLGDHIWRLKMIDEDGAFHEKLVHNKVDTVQKFLRMLNVKRSELREIVGDGMTDEMWETTTRHAFTCNPGNNVYAYNKEHSTIYVNSIFSLLMAEIDGVECPLRQLDQAQTMFVQQLILEAYEDAHNFMEVDSTMFRSDTINRLLRGIEHASLHAFVFVKPDSEDQNDSTHVPSQQ